MHTFNIFDDFLDLKNNNELDKSMELINNDGKGVIVILRNPKKEIMSDRNKGSKNDKMILKEYGIGAQILIKIGVKNIILLTNKNKSIIGIDGFGIRIKYNKKLD